MLWVRQSCLELSLKGSDMPTGQFYPGQKLVEETVIQDALFTYTSGLASKTVNPITPSFNGSGTAVTNSLGYNVNVYMNGGSVTTLLLNSGTIYAAIPMSGGGTVPVSNVTFFMKPGDTVTPTWIGANAPTWIWQAE
jgi:hypothetical protein